MHEMTEGGLPYDEARSYIELPAEHYSENLQQLIKRCTDAQPEKRPEIRKVLSEVWEIAGQREFKMKDEPVRYVAWKPSPNPKAERKTKAQAPGRVNSAKTMPKSRTDSGHKQ